MRFMNENVFSRAYFINVWINQLFKRIRISEYFRLISNIIKLFDEAPCCHFGCYFSIIIKRTNSYCSLPVINSNIHGMNYFL